MKSTVFLLVVLLSACRESPTAPTELTLRPTTLLKAGSSGVTAPRVERITTRARLVEVWNEIHSRIVGPNPVPTPFVDFSKDEVVLAARGYTPVSCYSVEIESVTTSDILKIHVVNTDPGYHCNCGAAVGYPVHLVAIPKTSGAAVIMTSAATHDCQ